MRDTDDTAIISNFVNFIKGVTSPGSTPLEVLPWQHVKTKPTTKCERPGYIFSKLKTMYLLVYIYEHQPWT